MTYPDQFPRRDRNLEERREVPTCRNCRYRITEPTDESERTMSVKFKNDRTDAEIATTSLLVQRTHSSEADFDALIHALRHPHVAFSAAADADLIARCAMEDWDASAQALKEVLKHHRISASDALAMLHLTGEFLRRHRIRLDGEPWLCTFQTEEGSWARYDVHTSLDYEDANTWDKRLDDVLRSRRLDRDSFYLRLTDGGPC